MMDIVMAEGLQCAAGMSSSVFSGSLPAFFSFSEGRQAKGACRTKGALVHVSSYEIDDGGLLELARAGGAAVFSLSDLLAERGFRRGILISKMRLLLAACRKRGTGFVFCSLAKGAPQQRNARELSAFASVLGATDVERKASEKKIAELAKVAK